MSMEPSSIELKVISCKDLKIFNFFQKLTIYALVCIDSNDPKRKLDEKHKQEQRTHTDKEGNGNPEWNQEVKFDLRWVSLQDGHLLFLHFKFRHDGLVLGDKLIGEVRVPLKDLIQEAGPALGVVRFVNYEVRNSDGKPNGILNFSYRVIDKKEGQTCNSLENLEDKITGYPLQDPALTDHNSPSVSSGGGSSYPTAMLPADHTAGGLNSPSAPPRGSLPSAADYHYYYPPPPVPPYPFPMQYPFPPPPPPPPPLLPPPPRVYGLQFYGPVGPEAHGWGPSDPNLLHPWNRRW